MKHLLLRTIAAVLLVGCGPSVDIWEAAATGNIEAVKQHLAAGWDVDAEDHYKSTPLEFAAQGGHKEIVELLIAEGADVNAKVVSGPKQGLTPLDAANETNHPETADLLRKHGGKTGEDLKAAEPVAEASDISIHDAAYEGNIEAVKQHIADGADVNEKDDSEWTPLHYAASYGRKEIANLLIAKGADVNAQRGDGKTPLDGAMDVNAFSEIADLIRKHGGKTREELKAEGK